MGIRILLADDHEIMREGMCALLNKSEDVEVVGQAADGREAVKMVEELSPDIVIMDIGMPNLNGIEATRQMTQAHPELKVMALSTHSDGSIVAKMLKAGAAGYMLKESAFSELLEGINAMVDNNTYLCSKIAKVVLFFLILWKTSGSGKDHALRADQSNHRIYETSTSYSNTHYLL